MFHEPPKNFLYSAYKITTEHFDGIKLIQGIATGFILEIAKGVPWIVTNRHVVDLDYKKKLPEYKEFKLHNLFITGRNPDDTEYTFQLHKDAEYFYHQDYENDVVLIKAHCYDKEGQNFHWHFGMKHLANKDTFNEILPFDLICYAGFPITHDKLSNRPIIRSGNIASDPHFDYSWENEYRGQCVAYEGFSSEGTSGSPVFAPPRGSAGIPNSRHGFLIGINAGHVRAPHGHSGVSYFYKSTVIHEIIEEYQLEKVIGNTRP